MPVLVSLHETFHSRTDIIISNHIVQGIFRLNMVEIGASVLESSAGVYS